MAAKKSTSVAKKQSVTKKQPVTKKVVAKKGMAPSKKAPADVEQKLEVLGLAKSFIEGKGTGSTPAKKIAALIKDAALAKIAAPKASPAASAPKAAPKAGSASKPLNVVDIVKTHVASASKTIGFAKDAVTELVKGLYEQFSKPVPGSKKVRCAFLLHARGTQTETLFPPPPHATFATFFYPPDTPPTPPSPCQWQAVKSKKVAAAKPAKKATASKPAKKVPAKKAAASKRK
jgi:hypothetical protein